MKTTFKWIGDSLINGVFVLAPVMVLGLLIAKAAGAIRGMVEPFAHRMGPLAGIPAPGLIASVLLVLICFLLGMYSKAVGSRKVVGWLESTVLDRIPGYAYMRGMGESMAGLHGKTAYHTVLARIEDAWQLGFIVETIEAGQYAVYVPGAPNPWSGSVYFMAEDRIRRIDMGLAEALGCLKRLGVGSSALLRGKL